MGAEDCLLPRDQAVASPSEATASNVLSYLTSDSDSRLREEDRLATLDARHRLSESASSDTSNQEGDSDVRSILSISKERGGHESEIRQGFQDRPTASLLSVGLQHCVSPAPPSCSFHREELSEMFRRVGAAASASQNSLSRRFLAARRSSSAGPCPRNVRLGSKVTLGNGKEKEAPMSSTAREEEEKSDCGGHDLRASRTEANIISAFEIQTEKNPPLLPLAPAPLLEARSCGAQREAISSFFQGAVNTGKATFVLDRSPITRGSFLRLIMKQFPTQPIPLGAIRLRKAFNGYLLEDNTGELGIARLPFFEGVLNTRSGSRWVSRYFVLHRGHWFWFETKTCYEVGGLENCVGSVSLLINEFSIDLDPKYVTRFSLTLRDWGCVIIDTGVQERDRGAWVLHFLAYKNKGDQLREKFPQVDWEELCIRSRLAIPPPK